MSKRHPKRSIAIDDVDRFLASPADDTSELQPWQRRIIEDVLRDRDTVDSYRVEMVGRRFARRARTVAMVGALRALGHTVTIIGGDPLDALELSELADVEAATFRNVLTELEDLDLSEDEADERANNEIRRPIVDDVEDLEP